MATTGLPDKVLLNGAEIKPSEKIVRCGVALVAAGDEGKGHQFARVKIEAHLGFELPADPA